MTLEDVSDCTRDSLIACEIGWNEDRIRTEALRSKCRHRRSHSKLSCFIRSGAYDRSSTPPGDDDRFAAKTWIIALFHRSVEGVHVDVHDLPRWRCHPVAIGFDRLHLVSTSALVLLFASARLRHVRSQSRAQEPPSLKAGVVAAAFRQLYQGLGIRQGQLFRQGCLQIRLEE